MLNVCQLNQKCDLQYIELVIEKKTGYSIMVVQDVSFNFISSLTLFSTIFAANLV